MLARERSISGAIIEPSSYFFKHPPVQFTDELCKEKVDAFIKG
jgi:myo-inositol-1-phosphate synthase